MGEEDTKATVEPTATDTSSLEKPSEATEGKKEEEKAGGKETEEEPKKAEPDTMEIDAEKKKDEELEVKSNEDDAGTDKMEEDVTVTKDEGQAEATKMDEDANGQKEQTGDGVSGGGTVEDTVMKENVESGDGNNAKDDEKQESKEADQKKAGKESEEDVINEGDTANGTKDEKTGDINEKYKKVETVDENNKEQNKEEDLAEEGKEEEDKEIEKAKVEDEERSEDENDNEQVESQPAKEDEKEERNDDKEDEKAESGDDKEEEKEKSKSSKKRGKGKSSGEKVGKKTKNEEEKKDSEPKTPFSDRPVRERKSVERLVAVIDTDSFKEFRIEKGPGAYLKDIPSVAYKVTRKKSDETLKLLHTILFGGRRGKAPQVKTNILSFSGFVWHGNEEKAKEKIKEKFDKCIKDKLVEFCEMFDIHVTKATTKEDIVTKLFEFLEKPHAKGDAPASEKEKSSKGAKRKRTPKKSSPAAATSSSKRSAKSQRKSEEGTKAAKKGLALSEDEAEEEKEGEKQEKEQKSAEEEENVNGIPDKSEDEAPQPSESEEKEECRRGGECKRPVVLSSELDKETAEDVTVSSELPKGIAAEKMDVGINHVNQTDKQSKPVTAHLYSSLTNGEVEHVEASLKSAEVGKRCATTTCDDGDEAEECTSVAKDVPSVSASASASAGSELEARVEFDLNEGFSGDDTRDGNSNNFSGSLSLTPTPLQPSLLPASVTVAAAAKGAFVPPDDLLRNKATVGWRGSAATSAFRPPEPRKVQEVPLNMNNVASCDASTTAGKQTKTFFDFDLNVPDERVLEELSSQRFANPSGVLDLDLNRLDDPADMNNHTVSSGHRVNSTFQQTNLSSGGSRDFDLNDGPAVDDVNVVESSLGFSQNSRSAQPMISGIRPGFSSWFPAVNNYSAMSIPQVLPERGNGPQRMVGPTSEVSSYTPDMYRGPVLLSSPAVSFPPSAFQYPGFPFGSSFPLSSANFSGASTPYMDSSSSGRLCFPPVNSQILGPGVAIPSNYPRPYVVNLPNSNGGVSDSNNAKWLRSGLDLNSGPGGHETDGRDEAALVQRQLSSSGSLPLKDEARMYQMFGGTLKRKEPDSGGWDGYKQPSWQ